MHNAPVFNNLPDDEPAKLQLDDLGHNSDHMAPASLMLTTMLLLLEDWDRLSLSDEQVLVGVMLLSRAIQHQLNPTQ